jgi:hypothetical protein
LEWVLKKLPRLPSNLNLPDLSLPSS